jgi:hypothetical protein
MADSERAAKRVRHHTLKVDPEPFLAMWQGLKKADLRDLSDRDIQVGDTVDFEEFDRDTKAYSGLMIRCKITHIQRGYILPTPYGDGFCSECGVARNADGAMLSFGSVARYKHNRPVFGGGYE